MSSPTYYAEGAIAYRTVNLAIGAAHKRARKQEETIFVISEGGHIYLASNEDLNTFWAGLSENQILYCTADH